MPVPAASVATLKPKLGPLNCRLALLVPSVIDSTPVVASKDLVNCAES